MMCELADICTAYNTGKVDVLPVKKTAKRTTKKFILLLLIEQGLQ